MGRVAAIVAGIVSLVVAAPASAAVRSGSETFNVNSSALAFNPPPPLPLLTIAVSYDDAGTITVTESGGNVPADIAAIEGDPSLTWADFNWEFGGISLFTSASTQLDIQGFGGTLTDNQVVGSLQPQVTPSTDGTSVTAVWSSPLLAGVNLTYVQNDGATVACVAQGCYGYTGGAFYFPGYAPTVGIPNPGNQRARVGFPARAIAMTAQLTGVASSDQQTSGIAGFSATGLPPGLRLSGIGQISGTPARTGSYVTTVTATGHYNNGTQATSASTTFDWLISLPPAKIPTFLGAPYQDMGLRAKPPTITYSGDGSAFFAGFGRASRRPKIGRLHWSMWTPTAGRATGGNWIDNCNPDCVSGVRTAYRVKLKAYRPKVIHGYSVFTRLAVTYTHQLPRGYQHRSYTLSLTYSGGGFYW